MTDREVIFDLIAEASKALIDSGFIVYEAGSLPKQGLRLNKIEHIKLSDMKPTFPELNHYRDSLITLIGELKALYVRIKEDK